LLFKLLARPSTAFAFVYSVVAASMDYNGFPLYSSQGTTNDPRPRFPSHLDARPGYAQNRFPAALPVPNHGYDPNLFEDTTEAALNNSIAPVGTHTFNAHDYVHVAPGYPSNYIPNTLDHGAHSYLQTWVDGTLISPSIELRGENSQWIPEAQSGTLPEAIARPFNISIDPGTAFSSQNPLDGTTLIQSSTNLRYPRQLSPQGSEAVFGECVDGQVIDYCYDTPNPTKLALARQEDLQHPHLFSQPPFIGGNMSELARPVANDNLSGCVSYSTCTQDMRSQSAIKQVAPTLGTKRGARENKPERKCVRCKVMKMKVSPPFAAALCHGSS
jgi:hypothetical protein